MPARLKRRSPEAMKALNELDIAALVAASAFVRLGVLPNPSEERLEPQCQRQS
jgi:hypothetical protein